MADQIAPQTESVCASKDDVDVTTTTKPKKDWSQPQNPIKMIEEEESFEPSRIFRHPRSHRVVISRARTKKEYQRQMLMHAGIAGFVLMILIIVSLHEFSGPRNEKGIFSSLNLPDSQKFEMKMRSIEDEKRQEWSRQWEATKHCGLHLAPSSLSPVSERAGYSLFAGKTFQVGEILWKTNPIDVPNLQTSLCEWAGELACQRDKYIPDLAGLIKPSEALANVQLDLSTGHLVATRAITVGSELFYLPTDASKSHLVAPSTKQYKIVDEIMSEIHAAQRKRDKRDIGKDSFSKRAVWAPAEIIIASVASKFDPTVGKLLSIALSSTDQARQHGSAFSTLHNQTIASLHHCADSLTGQSTIVSKRNFAKGDIVFSAPVVILPRGSNKMDNLVPFCFRKSSTLVCPSTIASLLVFQANSGSSCTQEESQTCPSSNLRYLWSPWNARNKEVLLSGPISEVEEDLVLGMTIDFVSTSTIAPGDPVRIEDVQSLFRSAWDM